MTFTEATRKYYSIEDPEHIKVMSAQGYPETKEVELRLLCGHSHRLPFDHPMAHYGFGTYPHHVPCPTCKERKGTST